MQSGTLVIDAFWISNNPFPTAQPPNTIDGKAFYHSYRGTARYLGWMDLILLKNIIKKQNIEHIILQNLDTLGKIAKISKYIKICDAYVYNSHIINSLSPDVKLSHCKPIYKNVEFGGWDSPDDSSQIHVRAQYYMRYLLIHTKVTSITSITSKATITASFDMSGNVVFETETKL